MHADQQPTPFVESASAIREILLNLSVGDFCVGIFGHEMSINVSLGANVL